MFLQKYELQLYNWFFSIFSNNAKIFELLLSTSGVNDIDDKLVACDVDSGDKLITGDVGIDDK
jgi:hypothetical protein